MVEATGCRRRQPTQVRSAAIDFAYGVTASEPPVPAVGKCTNRALRRPNSLGVLAHQFLDNFEKYGSDRQCGFRQREVIRGAK